MTCRIRPHQLDGVPNAVVLVCDLLDVPAGYETPTGAVRVDPTVLSELLATIDPAIEMLAFLTVDGDDDDAATASIKRLVVGLGKAPDHVAAIRRVPAVNAAKRVRHGVVIEAVDRATLNLLRPPEVVDRQTLETMLARLGSNHRQDPVNPTVLAASNGGRVLVVEDEPSDPPRPAV